MEISPSTFTPARRLLFTVCLSLAMSMVIIDMTVTNVSLLTISGELGVPPDMGIWIVSSYAVAEAIGLALSNFMARTFGRGRVVVGAICGFAFFSMTCGLAPDLNLLIASRIAQALCGGQIVPVAQSIIVSMYPRSQYGRAIAIVASIGSLAPVAGPILGGWITEGLSWRWIFFVNLPAAALILATIGKDMWSNGAARAKPSLDRVGILLLVVFVVSAQLVLDLGSRHDWLDSSLIAALLVAALFFAGLFVTWELWEPAPVLDLRIFANVRFAVSTAIFTAIFSCYFAQLVTAAIWLQDVLDYSSTWAGIATAGAGGISILALPVVVKLSKRLDDRVLIAAGCLLSGLSYWYRTGWYSQIDMSTVVWNYLLLGVATPFYSVPLTAIVLGSVEDSQTTLASGLLYFFRMLGAGVVTAAITALWHFETAVSRTNIAGAAYGSRLGPSDSAGLAGTDEVALLSQMVDREAITVAFNNVSALAAAMFLLAAALIWLLPPARDSSQAEPLPSMPRR
jgi:DHA2 family multidrug resistance protein